MDATISWVYFKESHGPVLVKVWIHAYGIGTLKFSLGLGFGSNFSFFFNVIP
jgi:hypothetical protein